MWWGVGALFRYLADEEDGRDIASSITVGRPADSDRITHLERWEVDRLLAACQGPKELAVISVFLDAGVRIAKASRLKVSDVLVDDLKARRLIVTGRAPRPAQSSSAPRPRRPCERTCACAPGAATRTARRCG